MRTIGFEKLLKKSLERTIVVLFSPFTFKKWFLLLFIAFMAGAMGGGGHGGGGGGSGTSSRTKDAEAWAQETSLNTEATGPTEDEIFESLKKEALSSADRKADAYEEVVSAPPEKTAVAENNETKQVKELWGRFKGFVGTPMGVAVVACLVLVVIGLSLVFAWLGARFRFIWFEALVCNDASIKAPFFKYAPQGDSLFRFFVVMSISSLSALGLLIWWGVSAGMATGIMNKEGPNIGALIGALAPPVILFILLIIGFVLVAFFTNHFVVTIMAMEKCRFGVAWRKFADVLSKNKSDFALFCLLSMGLAIAAAIVLMLAMLLFFLVILLGGGAIFGLLYLLLVGLLKLKILFYVVAVIIGTPLAAAALLVLISVPLPYAVFFRCFSLYFLTSLNCGYTPLPLEEIIPPSAPPAPPEPPAPLPPAPPSQPEKFYMP